MKSKKSLSEDEFKKLIERLSQRREELEGRITIDSVKESLRDLGLSDLLLENDIEEVRKQVSKEFARKQWKNRLLQAFILIVISNPLAAFGGYKLREYLVSNFPQLIGVSEGIEASELEGLEKEVEELKKNEDQLVVKLDQLVVKLEDSQEKNNLLESENDRLEKKVEELKNENQNPTTSVESENNVEDSSTKKDSSLKRIYEIDGFVFELQSCKKTNVNVDSQSINCQLLVTSTEKNARLSLYAQDYERSRIIEAGEIYLATKAQLGTSWGNSRATENLIRDVSLKASITFDKVSLEVNKIEVMEIFFLSNNKIPLEFRNVPVSE